MVSTKSQSHTVGLLPLWFGVLTGPIAWTAHLVISFLLVPYSCFIGSVIWLHVTTVITAAPTVAAGIVSYWAWKKAGVGEETDVGGTVGRSVFMAISGMYLSALFLLIILAEGMGPFFINPCQLRGGQDTDYVPSFQGKHFAVVNFEILDQRLTPQPASNLEERRHGDNRVAQLDTR